MRFDRIPSIAEPVPLSSLIRPGHRLQVVPLADDLVAAFFDATGRETVPTSHLAAWSGDEMLSRPLLGSRLVRSDGGLRYVFVLPRSSRELCRAGLSIAFKDRPLAEIDPFALQSPVVDPLALVVGLSPDGERRLLRMLLTTALSLFGNRAFGGIREIVLQLLERLAPPPLALRAWCPLGETAAIASYTLPRSLPIEAIGTLVAIGSGGAHVVAGAEADFETLGDERLLHLFLAEGMVPGSTLVALSDTPLRLAGPSSTQRQRPLGPWLDRRSPRIRRRTQDRLTTLAQGDETAAALVAEVSCPATSLPEVTPHLLRSTTSGILYAVGLRDPRRLLRNLVLRVEAEDLLLPVTSPVHHPVHGPVQFGHVAVAHGCAPGDEVQIFALYRSGRMLRIATVALEPPAATAPPLLAGLPDAKVAPALAAALADTLRHRQMPRVEVIPVAAPAETPAVTLLVDLGASLDYLFALAATLAGRRDVALTLSHPDRRALPRLLALGEEINTIYGLGVDLLDIADGDLLPAERVRAAAATVGTDAAIFLSGDVLPQGRSWLAPWIATLSRPEPSLVGAAALDHDADPGDLPTLPAGMEFDDGRFARAVGLNAAARAILAGNPLKVAGWRADLADLAAILRRTPGARVALDPGLRMTAFARAPETAAALDGAERLILRETLCA